MKQLAGVRLQTREVCTQMISKHRSNRGVIVVGWMVVLMMAGRSFGASYFVGPGGDDKASGLERSSALKSISAAVNRLVPGDDLTIAPGEYLQQVVVRCKGTAEQPIVIRAERPGFSVIRGSRRVRGFAQVSGTRFLWSAPVETAVFRVLEQDTQRLLFEAPALVDMDQFRGSYLYDKKAGRLYVHSSDGRSPDEHVVETYVTAGYGIEVVGAEHVEIEGLVVRGFGPRWAKEAGYGFGMRIEAQHITVRQCTFLYNGGGITLNAQHCVIRDSLFVGNVEPGYGELAQIYNTSNCDDNRCVDNVILDGETHGIRF